MAGVQTYLIFSGNCEEAVKFYCDTFDGQVLFTSRYKEAPMDCPEEWKEKIIHTTFKIRGDDIMASDGFPGHMPTIGNNVQISVNWDKNDKIDDVFNKLTTGGKITMPLQKTFWGAYFGQLVDRFGVSWMFNQNLEDKK